MDCPGLGAQVQSFHTQAVRDSAPGQGNQMLLFGQSRGLLFEQPIHIHTIGVKIHNAHLKSPIQYILIDHAEGSR